MNERKRVKVDEAALQRVMSYNDQSYLIGEVITPVEQEQEQEQEQEPKPEPHTAPEMEREDLSEQPEQVKEENPLPEPDFGKAPKKRKAPKSDFSELFLKERTVKNRKQIYISVETYDMIRRYLKYIGDVSFIAYVDNILNQHIEEHKDTITELFHRKVSQPF